MKCSLVVSPWKTITGIKQIFKAETTHNNWSSLVRQMKKSKLVQVPATKQKHRRETSPVTVISKKFWSCTQRWASPVVTV